MKKMKKKVKKTKKKFCHWPQKATLEKLADQHKKLRQGERQFLTLL